MKNWHRFYDGRKQDEHSLFEDENGRISIADNSGPDPDRTDDGPLYVPRHTNVTLTIWNGSPRGRIPVHVQRTGDRSSVSVSAEVLCALAARIPLTILEDDALTQLRRKLNAILAATMR